MKVNQLLIYALTCVFVIFSLTGCQIFIPAQANSNHRTPDMLTITLLTKPNLNSTNSDDVEFVTNYIAAFPGILGVTNETSHTFVPFTVQSYLSTNQPKFAFVAAIAIPLVVAGVQAGMAYISQSFSNEAALYQETLSGSREDDHFLVKNVDSIATNIMTTPDGSKKPYFTTNYNYSLNYYGFKITRAISLGDSQPTNNAYTLICGLGPTVDGALYQVKPLVFQTSYAGAKVVADDLKSTWLTTTLTLGISWLYTHWFLTPNHAINSQINVDFNAYSVANHAWTSMGSFSYKESGYDIANPKALYAASGDLPTMTSTNATGFIMPPPSPYAPAQTFTNGTEYAGNVDINATLLESDAANTQSALFKIGQLISDQTPKVTVLASNAVMDIH